MLQITVYIIQTTYLCRIPNPSMFSPDHVTTTPHVTTFLLFIFIWFIWIISLALIIFIIKLSIFLTIRVCVFNIHHIKVFNLFWHNDVCFINLFQCFAIITKSINWTLGASLISEDNLVTIKLKRIQSRLWRHLFCNISLSLLTSSETIQLFPLRKIQISWWIAWTHSGQLWQYTSRKWTFDNWPNTIRTVFILMGFKIIEWYTFHLVTFWWTQHVCNNILWLALGSTPINVANPVV